MSRERELLLVALDYLSTVGWSEEDRFVIVKLAENIRELLAQPEQHGTQYLLDQVAILTAENAMLKEKWSTPKRESLSEEEIGKGFLLTDVWHRYECFIAGVKYAEKHHSIGG